MDYFGQLLETCNVWDYSKKERAVKTHVGYMLNRLQSMFKWNGLPETIPQRNLELYLMINGQCAFVPLTDADAKGKGGYYVFFGRMGGVPDEYYMPTEYVFSSPYFAISKNLRINDECVVIRNDSLFMGLIPLLSRYATGLTESELTLKIALVNSRLVDLLTAADDRTKAAVDKFLSDVEQGKLASIADNNVLWDGIKALPYAQTSGYRITDLVEVIQYLKASWFNELGLNANWNAKRESIVSTESALNTDSLLPLIDDMMTQRQLACDQINSKYGLSLSVEFNSAWKDNEQELKAEQAGITQEDDTQTEGGADENADVEGSDTEQVD